MVIEGTYTAIVTPFRDEAGQPVDWDALDALIDAQIIGGVTGVVPCGTTGESPTLTHEEYLRVVAVTLEEAKADKRLAGMALVTNSRLSVQPVTEQEWKRIVALPGLRRPGSV